MTLGRLARPGTIAVLLIGYFALVMVLRLALFPGASEDDAEILYYTQSWAMGYKGSQPPLYAWLVLLASTVAGPGMAAALAVKYLLLGLFHWFAYLAGRRLIDAGDGGAPFAPMVPPALAACFFIGWDAVVNYSHTILLLAAMAATFWALLRLVDRAATVDYLVVGLAMAAGLLAKYNFAFFLVPALLAAWRHPALRPRLKTARFAAALGLAVALAALPFAWFVLSPGGLSQTQGAGSLFPPVDGRLAALGQGLGALAVTTLGIVSPMLPLAVGLGWPAFRRRLPGDGAGLAGRRFLETYLLALLALLVAAIAVTGATDVRNNWMVVWFPLPIYLLARIKAWTIAEPDAVGRRPRWLAGCLAVIALAVPVGLAARGLTGPQYCRKCNFFIRYAALSEALVTARFTGGTVVAVDRPNQMAGNLRRYFPRARFVSTRWQDYTPPLPRTRSAGQCLLIWRDDNGSGESRARGTARNRLGAEIPAEAPIRRAAAPLPRNQERRIAWSFILTDGTGDCR